MFDVLQEAIPSVFARFLMYGAIGWCAEIVFTGVSSFFLEKDKAATGKTYLWMHPVWGLTCLALEFLQDGFAQEPRLLRALLYVLVIYVSEFSFGWLFLKLLGRCPWDYTGRGINVMGLIRLDYAPAWLLAALIYEPMRTVVSIFANPKTLQLLSSQWLALN